MSLKLNLRQPCADCPFVRGVGARMQLHPARVRELATAETFACHKTVDYTENEDDDPHADGATEGDCTGASWCAGHLLFREHNPSQMMRITERLRMGLDYSKLGGRERVHTSVADMLEDHGYTPEHKEADAGGTGEPCSVCEDGCTAPAGWFGSRGVVSNDEANAEHWCASCGSAVCDACSHTDANGDVVCLHCSDNQDANEDADEDANEDANEVGHGG